MKIPMDAVENVYHLAKKVHANELTWQDATSRAVAFGGMSQASAHNFVQNYRFMREGKEYTRTMSVDATEVFLRMILADFGGAEFIKAVDAVKKHVAYYEAQPNGGRQPAMLQMLSHLEAQVGSRTGLNDLYPDEIQNERRLVEGAKKAVVVNAYERNPVARRKCLEHYGCTCSVCLFRFADKYGDLGADYIHVHHEIDLAEIGEEYEVDPINDLKPVCPNCHAMLHQKRPAYTIEELKRIIVSATG